MFIKIYYLSLESSTSDLSLLGVPLDTVWIWALLYPYPFSNNWCEYRRIWLCKKNSFPYLPKSETNMDRNIKKKKKKTDMDKNRIWTQRKWEKVNINVNRNTLSSSINQGDVFIFMVLFWQFFWYYCLTFIQINYWC